MKETEKIKKDLELLIDEKSIESGNYIALFRKTRETDIDFGKFEKLIYEDSKDGKRNGIEFQEGVSCYIYPNYKYKIAVDLNEFENLLNEYESNSEKKESYMKEAEKFFADD